jgi:hypothetical protein
MIMNAEKSGIFKELVLVYMRVLHRSSSGETEESNERVPFEDAQTSMCSVGVLQTCAAGLNMLYQLLQFHGVG